MLESLYIESYRTLRKTSVDFREGLNVIIGKNGVGKSNLLGFIANYTWIRLYTHGVGTMINPVSNYSYELSGKKSDGNKFTLKIGVEKFQPYSTENYSERPFRLQVERIDGNTRLSVPDYQNATSGDRQELQQGFLFLRPFHGTYIRFSLPETLPYLSIPGSVDVNDDGLLFFNRKGLTLRALGEFENFFEPKYSMEVASRGLGDLTLARNILFQAFEETIGYKDLNRYLNNFTNVQEVRLSPNANIYKTETGAIIDNLVVEFLIDDLWMPWNNLSDGTRRSFQIISDVVYAHYELVLIEEPEIGLHPTQLFKIMTFLKEQAQEKQIIISTHSPEVLNALEPDELDNILIATIEKGRTSFHRLSEHKKDKAKAYMTEVGDLSSYWLHSDMEEEEEEAAHD